MAAEATAAVYAEPAEPVEPAVHEADAPVPASRHAAVDPVASGQREAPQSRHAAIDPIAGVSRAVAAEPTPTPVSAPVEASAAFELPMASLQSVAEAAGLQWVNSDVDKIRSVQDAMAAEPAAVRVPRERKPVMAVDDGPLVLVETRKDLSQFKLPFDTSEGTRPPA